MKNIYQAPLKALLSAGKSNVTNQSIIIGPDDVEGKFIDLVTTVSLYFCVCMCVCARVCVYNKKRGGARFSERVCLLFLWPAMRCQNKKSKFPKQTVFFSHGAVLIFWVFVTVKLAALAQRNLQQPACVKIFRRDVLFLH